MLVVGLEETVKELNFIEMLWGYVKASHQCLRYMDGYRLGLIGPELDYAVRKYKGHRIQKLQVIKDEFKAQQEEKMKALINVCIISKK